MIFMVFVSGACAVERIPDTPSNAAIQLLSAMQAEDLETTQALVCDSAGSGSLSFDDPSSFGRLLGLFVAQQDVSVLGGASEYTLGEQVDLDVDRAWTELELKGEGSAEVWRLHMVREDGRWKACEAEIRG